MKKTISLVLVLAFACALLLQLPVLASDEVVTTTKATSSLEKILSPEQMNMYREIRKVGNDLFGIRKASSTIANITKNDEKKAEAAKNALEKKLAEIKKAGLEKIISLDQVKLFDKITKVGNDLFGVKKKGALVLPAMNEELIGCVSSAIDAKDASINITFTDSATEITTAIDARGTCQKEALKLNSGREEAVKACARTFQEATKTANEKAKRGQQEAWNTYKVSLKACSSAASTTEIVIEDGGEILK